MRLCLVGLVAVCLPAVGEVRLPHVLSDHAVLQREQPVRIWGWGAPAEKIKVRFHDQALMGQADVHGMWQVWLRPENAGGPYELTVTGDATPAPLKRVDILVGDVWIASGQSNMQMPLMGFNDSMRVKDGDKEIAAADHPKIRLLHQAKRNSAYPETDSDDVWNVCTPETAKTFSAVAYFFGRKIMEDKKVPVGLIDATVGATPAQAWISSEGIAWAGLPEMQVENAIGMHDLAMSAAIKNQYAVEDAAAKAAGKPVLSHPRYARDRAPSVPAVLFNGMIAPYTNYTIKGAIWYQGESDHDTANRYLNYSRVFPALIQDWRRQWNEGEFPFLYVQIASYGTENGWGNVRDAQRRTLELGNTAMVVTLDVGNPTNIHPPDKQTVGDRLAQCALGIVYGAKVETSSPLFVQATTEGSTIRAWFSHATALMIKDAKIGDFEVAGEDHNFVAATARIERIGDAETVVASAPGVPSPIYVRYGWQGYVTSYLYNSAGLPMGTFTSETDEWMLVH
jgi:sialate O-acetylesterase